MENIVLLLNIPIEDDVEIQWPGAKSLPPEIPPCSCLQILSAVTVLDKNDRLISNVLSEWFSTCTYW